MATLQIRDLPEDLHASLREAAARNHRSLAQQVIVELRRAQGLETGTRIAVLDRLAEAARNTSVRELPDLEAFIREDRER